LDTHGARLDRALLHRPLDPRVMGASLAVGLALVPARRPKRRGVPNGSHRRLALTAVRRSAPVEPLPSRGASRHRPYATNAVSSKTTRGSASTDGNMIAVLTVAPI